jgi:hypothetical protein
MDKAEAAAHGSAKFSEGRSALQQQDIGRALQCFEEAAAAYSLAGDDKKKELVRSMVSKLRAEAGKKKVSDQTSPTSGGTAKFPQPSPSKAAAK